MNKKSICLIFLLLICTQINAGVMSGIHRMRVLYTTYFDIIYPEDSAGLARLLEDRADPIYLKAKETIHADKNFRIVVVISPDSDSFSVTYSAEPYNRIVIYDAVPEEKDTIYEDMILGSFYREVLSAMGQSIKSGFWRFMSDFLGVDSLQPTSLMNLPFSFVKGISSLETDNKNVLNDSYNLQLLMQAKVDNTFPSWVDCAGSRDIYPCEELSTACGTAFAAFLQQRYGVNKYIEYWQECGHVYFIFFTQTIFKKVYGLTLDDAWAQFKDSVPVPEVNENGIIFSENAVSAIPNENRTLPVKLVSTPYGIVTYDDLTFEARLINPETPLFGSRFLFTLNHVTKISADDTGRFLAVSYERPKYRNNIKSDKTAVYDLKHRRFVRETYDFRDACIISVDGVYAVAGVYVDDKYPEIRIYYSEEINEILYDETRNKIYDDIDDDLIYRRAFNNSMIPYSLTRGPDGYLVSLFKSGSRRFFHFINVKQKSEKTTLVNLEPLGNDEQLKNGLTSLTTISESGNTFSFNYIPRDDFAFYRTGLIETDDDLSFKSISLQTFDVSGGVYNPVFYQSDIYFISRKSSYNEIKKIPANYLRVKNYEFTEAAFDIPLYNEVDPDDIELSTDSDRYNPFRYMFKGTWFPMLPVKNMSITEGVSMFPGLGVSYMTQSDPLSNNEITVSMGFGYAKLDFQNLVNPTQESLKLLKSQMTDFSRDMVTAFYLKNTTTPVDLIMGSMFKFDWSGQYDFLTMLGTSWKLDLGLGFGTLSFDIYSQYNASTFSKDLFDSEEKENLFYWPAIFSAYRIFNFDFSVEYSNIHQTGFSPYEKSGIKISSIFDVNWNSEDAKNENNILLSFLPTFVGFPLSVEARIPRLTPLKNESGWILGIPARITSSLFFKKGNTFSLDSEILLIGKEVQRGTPILNLYITRFSLSAGYNLAFDYNLKSNLSPDIRSTAKVNQVFENSYLNDRFYARANVGFSPVIGRATRIGMAANFEFVYAIRTSEFQFNFDMEFRM